MKHGMIGYPAILETVAPSRERELKPITACKQRNLTGVAPSRERELKHNSWCIEIGDRRRSFTGA